MWEWGVELYNWKWVRAGVVEVQSGGGGVMREGWLAKGQRWPQAVHSDARCTPTRGEQAVDDAGLLLPIPPHARHGLRGQSMLAFRKKPPRLLLRQRRQGQAGCNRKCLKAYLQVHCRVPVAVHQHLHG